jgi:bacteriocin-like protein
VNMERELTDTELDAVSGGGGNEVAVEGIVGSDVALRQKKQTVKMSYDKITMEVGLSSA